MVKKVVQVTAIFNGIDHRSLPMKLLQCFGHIFIKSDIFKEGVKNPAKKESRLMLKHRWVISFFSKKIHEISRCLKFTKGSFLISQPET
jgi:hypothetical protein